MKLKDGLVDRPVTRPCGKCKGCRLAASRDWGIRCYHEAALHENNIFTTLTYSNENLPLGGTLIKSHMSEFLIRLRTKFGANIRFYGCGEYGEQLSRPHYHVILFNFKFPDQIFLTKRNGFPVFTSKLLNQVWGLGLTEIGTVTFKSASYVARYILKKQYRSDDHYETVCPITNQQFTLLPEFTNMSRMHGIGHDHFQQHKQEIINNDFIVIDGRQHPVPRYYDKLHEKADASSFRSTVAKRLQFHNANKSDDGSTRLRVREIIQDRKLQHLPRNLNPETDQ